MSDREFLNALLDGTAALETRGERVLKAEVESLSGKWAAVTPDHLCPQCGLRNPMWERAEAVAAQRVGADPEVRDLLLYEFGTTEPELLREAMAELREKCERLRAENARLREDLEGVMRLGRLEEWISDNPQQWVQRADVRYVIANPAQPKEKGE